MLGKEALTGARQMSEYPIIVGDRPAELQALQILALSLAEAASRLSPKRADKTPEIVVTPEIVAAPLLLAAARAISLGSFAGIETPIEVLALSVRNSFEIWLKLLHIIESDENRQDWRNEALTDQIQVYEAMLTLQGPENVKSLIQGEIERAKQQAGARGLSPGKRPLMMRDLVKATKYKEEYEAFYKLYSKLVHPSAWFVNMPTAVASEMYRMTLIVNAQVYGWHILKAVEDEFGVSADQCRQAAIARIREPQSTVVH
jgi:hypothetical protein